jgi:hypothetical protein
MCAQRVPEYENLDVVLVGGFNPAIFHPQWFLRHDLIGEEEVNAAKVKVVSSEVTEIQFAALRIACFNERLTISASNIAYFEKVRDITESILALLPHTPVRACGINPRAHYRVTKANDWHKIGHTLAPKEIWNKLYQDPGMHSLTIRSHRTDSFPGSITVTVQPSDRFEKLSLHGLSIYVNNHFDVPADDQQIEGAETVGVYISENWIESCGEARRVADVIFKEILPNA